MPAFLVITAKIHDRDAFMARYAPAAAALVSAMGGRYVLRAAGASALESTHGSGMDGASVVVSQWPDRAAALAFWNSADYQAIKSVRAGLADVEVLLVEGALTLD